MKPLYQRMICFLLCTSFFLTSVWWVLTVPFMPERIYGVIPASVTFFSEHKKIVERWSSLTQNPILLNLLNATGIDEEEIRTLRQNPPNILNRLISERLILALHPSPSFSRQPTWILASWLGGYSQILRGWLSLASWGGRHPFSGCQQVGTYSGHVVWEVKNSIDSLSPYIYFSIAEGLLLACLSDTPQTIKYLLDVYDGLHPSLADNPSPRFKTCTTSTALDKGWIKSDIRDYKGPNISFRIDTLHKELLEGTVCMEDHGWLPPIAHANPIKINELDRILGDVPLLTLLADGPFWVDLLEKQFQTPWSGILRELKQHQSLGSVMIALFGGEYGGTFKQFPLPGLVMGIQMTDKEALHKTIDSIIDRLNAEKQWGLIKSETKIKGWPYFSIEGTANNFYSTFNDKERFAYTLFKGWFLLASNTETLKKIIQRYRSSTSFSPGNPHWSQDLDPKGPLALYGYIQAAHCAKIIQPALNLYSLKLLVENSQASKRHLNNLKRYKKWLEAAELFDVCRLEYKVNTKHATLRFSLEEKTLEEMYRDEK